MGQCTLHHVKHLSSLLLGFIVYFCSYKAQENIKDAIFDMVLRGCSSVYVKVYIPHSRSL